jgi:hypothetical protein
MIGESKTPSTTVTVLVDEQLREDITKIARANERSVGAEVRIAMRDHLKRTDGETEEA